MCCTLRDTGANAKGNATVCDPNLSTFGARPFCFAEPEKSSIGALTFYMTLVRHKETLLIRGIVGNTGTGLAGCMTSQRQPFTCYRRTKFSSNRHRKLQPFRET